MASNDTQRVPDTSGPAPQTASSREALMANAVRALAMDAVQQANSGHPGAPMGMAEMAVALWGRHLRHNPAHPQWPDRDRFVLSNGHASMLLYALLHLTGYELPMSELRNFRQLHSKTPGHPEVGITPGVETTTGPLGQGLANAVGMALAEKLLAQEFNRPGHTVVDHHTYVFMGDGCLMEGVSHEACALAGAWKLNKLVALYDSNGISIDGRIEPWYADDTARRFEAYGWQVIGPVDGHDVKAMDTAIAQAKKSATRPSIVICRTSIGRGSPNRSGTAKAHGEPLGADEIKATRAALGWSHEPFVVPEPAYAAWDARAAGVEAEAAWSARFASYKAAHPDLAAELARRLKGELPKHFAQTAVDAMVAAHTKAETVASRKASQIALEGFTKALPELLGGSADLTGSNLTNTSSTPPLRIGDDGTPDGGRHINYGVREFGMAAVMNGVALHGGYIPYGGTFLTFSDYSRNALRMAALMGQRVITSSRTIRSAWARTVPRTRASSTRPACASFPGWTSGARATPPRPPPPGPAPSSTAAARARCCCRARTCPTRPRPAWTSSAVVPTCWPSRPRWACRARRRPSSWPPAARCSWRCTRRPSSPGTASPCAWCRCPAPPCSASRWTTRAACCRPRCRESRWKPA